MSFFEEKIGGKKAHMAQANGYYKVILHWNRYEIHENDDTQHSMNKHKCKVLKRMH